MMCRMTFAQLGFAAALSLASPALAQSGGHGSHGSHGAAHAQKAEANPASAAFAAANAKMHEAMNIRFSGDADVDFARGMIAHHQGAVDMAKILLAHGKDPEMRKLAEEVVRTQEAEIAFMKNWLAKKGK